MIRKLKIKKDILFIIVFIATILSYRIGLFFVSPSSSLWYDKIHHVYTGIGIVTYLMLYSKKWSNYAIVPLAIGCALIADEIIFLLPYMHGDGTKPYYFGIPSIVSTLIVSVLMIYIVKSPEKIKHIKRRVKKIRKKIRRN